MTDTKPTLAVIGGTGALGSGLALRWAKAGYDVIIGSRSQDNADRVAADLSGQASATVRGMENGAAAAAADVSVLTVPFSNHQPMIDAIRGGIQGKVLIDATVPLVPPKVARVQLPPGGSLAKMTQEDLGENVRVVSAFQNVAADLLQDEGAKIDCDILVCGNNRAARQVAIDLAVAAGLKAWHAGPIDNSAAAEALTSILIFLNRSDGVDHAGIRITGARGA